MITPSNTPTAHAGEGQSSPGLAAHTTGSASSQPGPDQYWARRRPSCGVTSLAELAKKEQTLRAGDIVYITRVCRHVLTEGELNAAARAVIGGAS